MAHVGTITGSMILDPSGYIAGLNQAAQQTLRFQQSIAAGSFGMGTMGATAGRASSQLNGLNRSIYASMTAFYALSRMVTSSLGVFEEYDNIISRIAATSDSSTSSILRLSESLKGLNREMAGSRTDMARGMYRAVQAGFTSPSEFMPIAESAMRLRTASGREINTVKSADAISVIRNSLGIKSGREGFITDMLLRGRDVGRFELNEMTSALGIPLTIYGNQFSSKIGAEETLRQVTTMLSSTTQAGLSPTRAATGIRRMVEKSILLGNKSSGSGKNIHNALRGLGYGNVFEALDEGPMSYLHNLLKLSRGGDPEILGGLGYRSREMMVLAATLRDNMGQTQKIYNKLAPGEISGTTDKYIDQMKKTWWYQRDRVRGAYEDSQNNLMQAMLPTMKAFATSIETLNDLFQALSPTLKNLLGLMTVGAGATLLKNFYFRGNGSGGPAFSAPRLSHLSGVAGTGAGLASMGGRTPSGTTGSGILPSAIGRSIYGYPEQTPFRKPGGHILPEGWKIGPHTSPFGVKPGGGGSVLRDDTGKFRKMSSLPRTQVANPYPSFYMGGASATGATLAQENVRRLAEAQAARSNVDNWSKWKRAGQFISGGSDYRQARVEYKYQQRLDTAQQTYQTGKDTAYQTAAKMVPTQGIKAAGDYLYGTMNKLERAFNASAKSAAFAANSYNRLSGAMSAISSIANVMAIGGILSSISSFVSGLKGKSDPRQSNGLMEMPKGWHYKGALDPRDLIARKDLGLQMLGGTLVGDTVGVLNAQESFMEGRGYVEGLQPGASKKETASKFVKQFSKGTALAGPLGAALAGPLGAPLAGSLGAAYAFKDLISDKMDIGYKKADFNDMVSLSLSRHLTPGERAEAKELGLDRFNPTTKREFAEWMQKKRKLNVLPALSNPESLQHINPVSGESNLQMLMPEWAAFVIATQENTEATKANTASVAQLPFADHMGPNVGQMALLRANTFANIPAVKAFWKSMEEQGAYTTDEAYQQQLLKQFVRGGYLPDSYLQERALGQGEGIYDYNLQRQGKHPKLRKGETVSAMLERIDREHEAWDSIKEYEGMGGSSEKLDSIRNAMLLLEKGRDYGSMSEAGLKDLARQLFGQDGKIDDTAMRGIMSQLRLFDMSKYITLAGTGEHMMTPVQKYSDALAFGTDAGYNATLPYWAEKGDEHKEMIFKIDELIEWLRGIADSTKTTANNTGSIAAKEDEDE